MLGLVCPGDSECSLRFLLGTKVTLLARPDDDATFVGWFGQCRVSADSDGQAGIHTPVGPQLTAALTLSDNTACRAVFQRNAALVGLSTESAESAPASQRSDSDGPVNGREPR